MPAEAWAQYCHTIITSLAKVSHWAELTSGWEGIMKLYSKEPECQVGEELVSCFQHPTIIETDK